MPFKFEHRHGRRLRMRKTAPGMVLGGRVDIFDLGVDSVGIEHDFPMTLGASTFLEFSWGTDPMQLACIVARTDTIPGQPGRYRSGLKVLRGRGVSEPEFNRRVKEGLEKLKEAESKLPPAF